MTQQQTQRPILELEAAKAKLKLDKLRNRSAVDRLAELMLRELTGNKEKTDADE